MSLNEDDLVYDAHMDARVRAAFRSQVNQELASIRAEAEKTKSDIHAIRSDWPEFKASIKAMVDLVQRVDTRTQQTLEKLNDLDKGHSNAVTRIETLERNITELWGKHANNENRWRDHDELAAARLTALNSEITAKNQQVREELVARFQKSYEETNAAATKANAKAGDAERKADAIMERFKGVSYVWGVVGAGFVAGGFWLVSTVSSLDKKMYAVENSLQTAVKLMQNQNGKPIP